jgi:hypothetical protein
LDIETYKDTHKQHGILVSVPFLIAGGKEAKSVRKLSVYERTDCPIKIIIHVNHEAELD